MWQALLTAAIPAITSWLGGEKQADSAAEGNFFNLMLNQKAGKNLQKAYDSLIADITANPSGYAGTRTQAALYDPVNISESQRSSVQGNVDNLDLINQLVSRTNSATTGNDIARALTFDPNAMDTLGNLGEAANLFSQGKLPADAIQDIISNSSAKGGSYNTPGGSGPATLRDLGMSSVDAYQRGASLFSQIMAGAESISPVSRQIAAPQFFITPQQGLQTDLQQAQLMQNSQQNAYNLASAPDPGLQLQAQLRLQSANNRAAITTGAAGMQQPNMTPYASMYGQVGNALSQGLGAIFGGGAQMGGGFSSGFGSGFNPAAYNASALNYNLNSASGTAPKAYVV